MSCTSWLKAYSMLEGIVIDAAEQGNQNGRFRGSITEVPKKRNPLPVFGILVVMYPLFHIYRSASQKDQCNISSANSFEFNNYRRLFPATREWHATCKYF